MTMASERKYATNKKTSEQPTKQANNQATKQPSNQSNERLQMAHCGTNGTLWDKWHIEGQMAH
jgi:hypothetical protein